MSTTEDTNKIDIEEENQIGVLVNSVYEVTKTLAEWKEQEEEEV